jgi:hypothetical protein
VATVFNAVMTFRALTYQKIILVPPGLDTKATISGDNVDEALYPGYQVRRYLASITPGTVKPISRNCSLCMTPITSRGEKDILRLMDNIIKRGPLRLSC